MWESSLFPCFLPSKVVISLLSLPVRVPLDVHLEAALVFLSCEAVFPRAGNISLASAPPQLDGCEIHFTAVDIIPQVPKISESILTPRKESMK